MSRGELSLKSHFEGGGVYTRYEGSNKRNKSYPKKTSAQERILEIPQGESAQKIRPRSDKEAEPPVGTYSQALSSE